MERKLKIKIAIISVIVILIISYFVFLFFPQYYLYINDDIVDDNTICFNETEFQLIYGNSTEYYKIGDLIVGGLIDVSVEVDTLHFIDQQNQFVPTNVTILWFGDNEHFIKHRFIGVNPLLIYQFIGAKTRIDTSEFISGDGTKFYQINSIEFKLPPSIFYT